MTMNLLKTALCGAAALLAAACSSDDAPAQPTFEVTGCSIVEDAVINPTETESVTFTYSGDVTVVNPGHSALVNDTRSTRTVLAAGEVAGNTWTVPVALEPECSYTLMLTGTTAKSSASGEFAKTRIWHFTTSANLVTVDKSLLDASLTDSKATPEAVKVFAQLKKHYGVNVISGAMGGVGWEHGFYDLVSAEAGKHPAIEGFDYLHLPSSPANWIDYGDITPVLSAWQAGTLPAVAWHWNVPDGEGSTDLTSNTSKFNAANVLVEGTWENGVANADVAKLAGYLKLLQDAGIPVLWRPFHEAAGDYTWGAWFWWGMKGPEVTKQLWAWLRAKLTEEYGLHNLIWVWTVQTSDQGQPASIDKLRGAYPGNETVDLVGCDLYVPSYSDQSGQFSMLYALTGGRKMVTLAECGNLLDPEADARTGSLWSYFMGWYEYENNKFQLKEWNTAGEWKKVLSEPLVLNRGDINWTE